MSDLTQPTRPTAGDGDDIGVQRPISNRLAVAALALGIVGAALSLVPIAGPFLCWLPSLLAIVFGFVSLRTARNLAGLRHTEALWGVLLGFAPIPITTLWLALGTALGSITDHPLAH